VGITPLPGFGSPVSLHPPAGWLHYVRSALLSIFFPAGCRICDRMLTEPTRLPICNECLGSSQLILGTVCDKCGNPVENAPTENKRVFVCPRGTGPDHRSLAFDRVCSWSFYDGAVVRAILFLKFENIYPLGELFAGMLAEMAVLGGPALEADVAVSVPRHRRRQSERATNRPPSSPNRSQNALAFPTNPSCSPAFAPAPKSIC